MQNPVELLAKHAERAFWTYWIFGKRNPKPYDDRPGKYFESLSEEDKDVLRQLTSGHDIRFDAIKWMINE
jgi:hypothetical protein